MSRCTFCWLEPANPTHPAGYCDDCAQEAALDELEWARLDGMTEEQVNAELLASGMTQEQVDSFVRETTAKLTILKGGSTHAPATASPSGADDKAGNTNEAHSLVSGAVVRGSAGGADDSEAQ